MRKLLILLILFLLPALSLGEEAPLPVYPYDFAGEPVAEHDSPSL